MIEPAEIHADFCDIEEMVRTAGSYLEISADLRPRTLEEARDESRETSTRSWITAWGLVLVLLAISVGRFRDGLSSAIPFRAGVSANGDLYRAIGKIG